MIVAILFFLGFYWVATKIWKMKMYWLLTLALEFIWFVTALVMWMYIK